MAPISAWPPRLEAVADGQHPAARALLRLEDGHLVAVLHQVVRGGQAREPGPEHHDAVAAARCAAADSATPPIGQRDGAGGGDVPQERSAIE